MRAAGSGKSLLSVRLDTVLQRHRCRIKDWPSSQAAASWIFSTRAAGSGQPLLSSWVLQRHRCRIKDWPSSQAAASWIFSTRAAGSGQPLLSAMLDLILQRHRCRIKDWPSSQAAVMVCDLIFALLRRVCCGGYSERDAFFFGCRLSALSSRC
jgi:hypothetical protein